jgi:hypothetical protein
MTGTQDGALADLQGVIATLKKQLDEQRAERDAALSREAALAEVLDVINRSPGDPGPVFEAILEKAHRLCGADAGALMRYDGEYFHAVATHGLPDEFAAMIRRPFRGASHQRLIDGDRIVHVADAKAIPSWRELGEVERAFVERTNLRTSLFVPLRKDDVLLGFISADRHEVRPFSHEEIALLESFAAQAVIAMENARLFGVLQERTAELAARDADNRALIARQDATIEVMKTISASPDDTQPVFELIARRTRELCDARAVVVHEYDGTLMHIRAIEGHDPAAAVRLRETFPRPPGPETIPDAPFWPGRSSIPATCKPNLAFSRRDVTSASERGSAFPCCARAG